MSVYDVLAERGFLKQVSHEEEIRELLEKEKITFYIGFDPTADNEPYAEGRTPPDCAFGRRHRHGWRPER